MWDFYVHSVGVHIISQEREGGVCTCLHLIFQERLCDILFPLNHRINRIGDNDDWAGRG